jgi:hypothetical protein
MGQKRRFQAARALAALGLFVLATSSAALPDLSGTWSLVPKRSDDVRGRIIDAAGIGYTQGDVRKGAPRAWIHDWLMAQAEQPEARVLTIEQSPAEFKTGVADDLRLYYFAREAKRQGPEGSLRSASVRWQGEQVVVQERADKGSGRLEEVYTLQPDGRTLVVDFRLEHKALRQPLELRLVFEKTAP